MNETQRCLKSDQLRKLMECELAAADVAAAEEHLSVCDHCRATLDRAIGNADWWQEARESLSHGEGDRPVADDAKAAHSDVLALLGPTDDAHMLGRIGTYEIIGILGRGGMGVVFKGFDGALNRYVAIKMLLPHLAASGGARKRFAREAQAAAAVVHDHVMAIHNVAEWQGVPYLVMPYGRGVSLQKRLSDKGPLEVREILRIGMQTAAGLAAAHAQGLVHRDVKPANILLAEDVERVTLTDFGLARAVDDASLTRSGTLAGTPQYMSPEQARSEFVDARSDLFSLGSVLYAMCTGRSPFRADSSYGVLRLISDDEPTPIREINPEIPDWLRAIVSRLMAKRPEDRFSSAIEVAELLESCLAHVQQPTAVALPSSLSRPRAVSFSRHHRNLFTGVLIMFATLAVGLVAMLALQGTAPPDIAGEWTGEDWGAVVLEVKQPGQYEGSYREIERAKAGTVRLKWSRVERRFNGTWEEGDERSGKISLRVVGDDIRGAWTTGKNSPKANETPRLADLLWKRSSNNTAKNAILELLVDKELRYSAGDPPQAQAEEAKDSKLKRLLKKKVAIVQHTTTEFSTLASDCTTYFSGDAEAFNAMIAKLASEFIPTIGENGKVVPNPKLTVSIYKSTGKAYLTESMTRKPNTDESILFHVPPVPREVISGQLPAFTFDWIVVSSATNNAHREVSVMLFAGGNVDLVECVIPDNVLLKIAKSLVLTTTPAVPAKPGNRR